MLFEREPYPCLCLEECLHSFISEQELGQLGEQQEPVKQGDMPEQEMMGGSEWKLDD